MGELKLKTVSISDLVPYEKNARKNQSAVQAVAESIKQCDYVAPIIVDENNVILAGHTRYKALQLLEYEKCQVIVKAGLTEEQKKKYRLLDNKTAEFAEWDYNLLPAELEGLDFGGFDFGFVLPDDFSEDIDDEEVGRTTSIERVLSIDGKKIAMTEDEYNGLMERYDTYVDENGVSFGFVMSLLEG